MIKTYFRIHFISADGAALVYGNSTGTYKEAVAALLREGAWIDEQTWLSPGAITVVDLSETDLRPLAMQLAAKGDA